MTTSSRNLPATRLVRLPAVSNRAAHLSSTVDEQSRQPVTDGERVSIISRHYTIEHPSAEREFGSVRYVGFCPGDRVLVIGKSAKGGVAAGRNFEGTRAQPGVTPQAL
jgi:hypothetical protein